MQAPTCPAEEITNLVVTGSTSNLAKLQSKANGPGKCVPAVVPSRSATSGRPARTAPRASLKERTKGNAPILTNVGSACAQTTGPTTKNQTGHGPAPSTPKGNLYNFYISQAKLHGVASLSGNTINLPMWRHWLPIAVKLGYIDKETADFVLAGLTQGFDLGLNEGAISKKTILS